MSVLLDATRSQVYLGRENACDCWYCFATNVTHRVLGIRAGFVLLKASFATTQDKQGHAVSFRRGVFELVLVKDPTTADPGWFRLLCL